VLAEFLRRGCLEAGAAAGVLAWPHPGFGAYLLGPPIAEREALLRVARYSARASQGQWP
jgi:hypothetical protein